MIKNIYGAWIQGRSLLWTFLTTFLLMLAPPSLSAQDAKYVPIETVVQELKNQNFFILTLGIISDGIDDATISKITDLQFLPPRTMRIFVTKNTFIQDIFNDFTFLVRNKQVDAILIWPSKTWDNKNFVTKIVKMSQRLRVPLIALQPGWIEEGAMIYFADPANPKMIVNDNVTQILNFPVNLNTGFPIEHQ